MIQYWPYNEISTRNCYNCTVRGRWVNCRMGHSMRVSKHKYQLTYIGVIRDNRLLSPCTDCREFDGKWEDLNERRLEKP